MTTRLHIISHTHWDREWYLTFQQFRLKLVQLVDGLLEILDNDPEFKHFMLDGQTILLDDYLFMRPEQEERLREHVQGGRLLIGPWHILPDMFLVGAEAHIRNLLQGRRTAQKFGPLMPVGYIPDPFGHPGQIPQILRGFGIHTACVWRGLGDQPCEFWWQSPDGSRVLMAYLRESYSNGASLPADDPARFAAQLAQMRDQLSPHSASDDLLVMYGTDHMQPPLQTSQAIAYANKNLGDTQVLHSTLPLYIQALSAQIAGKQLPLVEGELRECSRSPLLPGVLSTRMTIKQRNAQCETLLEKWVEPFGVFADLCRGDPSANAEAQESHGGSPLRAQAGLIRQAWRLLMENHPHDSICGCSIDQVANEMAPRFDQVEQIGEELARQSLERLAAHMDTQLPAALSAVVLFNPCGEARRDLVEVEVHIPEEVPAFELVDSDGGPIPYEMVGSAAGEFANLLVDKKGLRETFANIHEGRAAGVSIVKIIVGERAATVNIDAVVSEHDAPDMQAWNAAVDKITKLEADPGVTLFHIQARLQRSSRLRLVTPEIPPHGWRVLWARPAAAPAAQAPQTLSPIVRALMPLGLRLASSKLGGRILARLTEGDERKPPFVIQNEFLRLEASQKDGTLTLTDKRTGMVYSGVNRFVDGADAGDEYNYSPPAQDALVTAQLVSLKVFRSQVAPALEIACRLRLPSHLSADRKSRSYEMVDIPITSRVTLAQGVARLDVHTEIENRAKDHRLRVHFPAPFKVAAADYDGHFEVLRRKIGLPEPGKDWVEAPRPETHQRAFTDISDGSVGLMLANRGLPEVEVLNTSSGAELALTLLRCVGGLSRDDLTQRRGHAGPGTETPGAQMPGKCAFDYALIPHAGDWRSAYPEAYAFNAPLRAVTGALHAGNLPACGSFIEHSPAQFVISALKPAEDGEGWIVRGYNITAQPVRAGLRPARTRPAPTAHLANMAEETLEPLPVEQDGWVHFTARGHEVVTVKFR